MTNSTTFCLSKTSDNQTIHREMEVGQKIPKTKELEKIILCGACKKENPRSQLFTLNIKTTDR